jgi:hypothetical protein
MGSNISNLSNMNTSFKVVEFDNISNFSIIANLNKENRQNDKISNLKINRAHSINILYNNKSSQLKRRFDSPEKQRIIPKISSLPTSPIHEFDDKSVTISEMSPKKQNINFKMDENIIFTDVRVMKNITQTFDKNNNNECEYIITEENESEAKFDIKTWFNKFFHTIIRITMLLIMLYINSLLVKFEMFLGVYLYIILINNTRKSIISQDVKQMSICLKRW